MDLVSLVTEIVVTPKAEDVFVVEIENLTRAHGYSIPVRASGLARYKDFLPY